MIKIITYPKKKFDEMVRSNNYDTNDYFISIGYTKTPEDFEEGYDLPVLPSGVRVKSVKPGFDTPEMPEAPRFLRSKFDDIIEDFGPHNIAFKKHNAMEILEFLSDAEEDMTIHVHCQAGQSRSVAVAESLKEIYVERGKYVDLTHVNSYICPNKTVLRIMLENKEHLK